MNNLIMKGILEKYELSSFWNDGEKNTPKTTYICINIKAHWQSNNIMHTCIFMKTKHV